jgi:hypothetical protein
MNITEDKLKAGIQIALGTLGLYTEEAETLLIHHIKALTIPDVVSCVCKIPEPRLKVSENGTHAYCNNCAKTYWQK